MKQPLISIVIAAAGDTPHLDRVVAAYKAETAVGYELTVYRDTDQAGCWRRGQADANGTYVHLGDAGAEPHPGWHVDAIAAARAGYCASPMLWWETGIPAVREPVTDWELVQSSQLPFVRNDAGPLSGRRFVLRTRYAFTLLG